MPWQAHLFIGERVANDEQVVAILKKLGADPAKVDACKEDLEDYDPGVDMDLPKRSVTYRGVTYEANAGFYREREAGDEWPCKDDDPNTFAMVCIPLTSRYSPAILDVGNESGRPDPFVIDIEGAADLLRQVREWWPDAQFLICDIYF